MKDLRLTEIWIYPIKSLGGISLSNAKVMPKGLAYDRRWMLVDEQGVFMTQRVEARMALLKLSIESDHIIIKYKGQSTTVELNGIPGRLEQVKIWDDTVSAYEISQQHSAWFSQILGMNCRLMSFPEDSPRAVDPDYKVNDEHVSLADAYPFMIIGQSSLDNLNGKLKQPLPMNRFRPNFVFTGGDAFEEDTWRNFTIGANRFVGVKQCARCTVITIDQDTGEKNTEPTKTLSTFRARNNKIYFGQNLVAIDHHQVTVGDVIRLN